MCKFNWFLLLEYLKILLTWPPIVFGIFVLFRTEFANFLSRIIKGNFFGQSVEVAYPAQYTSKSELTDSLKEKASQGQQNANMELPPEIASEPNIENVISWIKEHPADTVLEYRRVLFNYNAERLFNVIYGSQINMLNFLASHSTERFTLNELSKFYEEFKNRSANASYQLHQYIKFLENWGVISVEKEPTKEDKYGITPDGEKFLSYIQGAYPTVWDTRSY